MGESSRPAGVLLINLGSPSSPATRHVRSYLKEFLSDPRVLDIPAPLRWLLLRLVILPFRSPRSAAQYRQIWTPEGSPLRVHGLELAAALQTRLGAGHRVALGMRYGEPALGDALDELLAADVERVRVIPLFPQEASASSGSALEQVYAAASARWNVPPLEIVGPFFADPGFISAVAEIARPLLTPFTPDHVLFSYHGLPESHMRRGDPSAAHCLESAECCAELGPINRHCYRAQCYATTRAVAGELGLAPDTCSSAFQSRLGRAPWIEPHTDALLPRLATLGVRRLAILCPSFVADCLETLEEIGIRARAQWAGLGGEALELIPCVNSHPTWVNALANLASGD